MRKVVLLAVVALVGFPAIASAQSDREIVSRIIAQSRGTYHRTSGPCACPDDAARGGSRCGRRSAYDKAGGIICYPRDVTRADIAAYRASHR